MKNEIEKHVQELATEIKHLETLLSEKEKRMTALRTPRDVCDEYIHLTTSALSNKERKKATRRVSSIEEEYRYVKNDVEFVSQVEAAKQEVTNKRASLSDVKDYISNQVNIVAEILEKRGFIQYVDNIHIVTSKGILSSHIQEIPGHIFSELMIRYDFFEKQNADIVAGLFSCFTNITANESCCIVNYECRPIVDELRNITNEYYDIENANKIDISENYEFHTHIVNEVIQWCSAENESECKNILSSLCVNKGIFLGDFIKAILKINNIATELLKLTQLPVSLQHKLTSMRDMTQKYVVTNQSLYI